MANMVKKNLTYTWTAVNLPGSLLPQSMKRETMTHKVGLCSILYK